MSPAPHGEQIRCCVCDLPVDQHYELGRSGMPGSPDQLVIVGFPGSGWHLVRTEADLEDMLRGGRLPPAQGGWR